eukprot:gnl/Trimastix_PCT/2594.p1 GENE.gnl/Trimastix_PCT/2594~~gnl/Trimastix_PCT/2594.p1  ORF type:complete len:432 (+),score=45.46 gnl/Trimastix_PCT/2594:83-1297(+)
MYIVALLAVAIVWFLSLPPSPSPLPPVTWSPDSSEAPVVQLRNMSSRFPMNYPESFAFINQKSHTGWFFTGLYNGEILKVRFHPKTKQIQYHFVAVSGGPSTHNRSKCDRISFDSVQESLCSRPLGLAWDTKDETLFIADAYHGLLSLKLSPICESLLENPQSSARGEMKALSECYKKNPAPVTHLLSNVDNQPILFSNAVLLDRSQRFIYLIDSSTLHTRAEIFHEITQRPRSGRLVRYDRKTHEARVIASGLAFANGMAFLDEQQTAVIVAETSLARLTKIDLATDAQSHFLDLPGYPDNITPAQDPGTFWVGLPTMRSHFLDTVTQNRVSCALMRRFPQLFAQVGKRNALALKVNAQGQLLRVLYEPEGHPVWCLSEVHETQERILFGSYGMPYLGWMEKN